MGCADFLESVLRVARKEWEMRVPRSARASPLHSPPRMKSGGEAVLVSFVLQRRKIHRFAQGRRWHKMLRRFTTSLIVAGSVALREIMGGKLADLSRDGRIEVSRVLVILQVPALARSRSTANQVGHTRNAGTPEAMSIVVGRLLARRAEHLWNGSGCRSRSPLLRNAR
jgi:hypothetical protein